jgi:AraC-like DNA-binding protein
VVVTAVLLERRSALQAFRRALPRSTPHLVVARSAAHLETVLRRTAVDAVVISADSARGAVLDMLRRDFAAVPVLLYLPMRSDDAELLRHAHRERVSAIAVEGLDEPMLPRLLRDCSLTARRVTELLPLGPALDLIDSLQQRAWQLIVTDAPAGISTTALARQLGVGRETLSRRFAAGSAPSLKRAIDAVRLIAAAQLLGNAAYRVVDVARLLHFSSASSLQLTARRTFAVAVRAVAALPTEAIVARLRGDTGFRWE